MGFLTVAFVACACGAPAQERAVPSSPWIETWSDLGRLSAAAPGSAEFQRTWRELDGQQIRRERSARRKGDRVEGLRVLVLRAHLSRLAGVPWNEVAELDAAVEFLQGEAWVAVQVAGPGPTRVRALSAALREVPDADLEPVLARGIQVLGEDVSALQLDWALAEVVALDERAREGRTARLRGRVLTLRGEHEAAVRFLSKRVESTSDPNARASLLLELGRAQMAGGDDDAGWRSLGGALALGSRDAGLYLAQRALADGQGARARVLFRGLLEHDPALVPARRGYGLALLETPEPRSAPRRNLSGIPR